jgi:hypothetical protein
MPQPEYGQVHVNVPLTNISVAYQQDATNFIADQIFPMVPVDKQGNLYYEYLLEDWIRITAEERAPGTESAGGGWDLTNHPYFCRLFSIHKDIDDQTAQNADSAFNLDRDASQAGSGLHQQLPVSGYLGIGLQLVNDTGRIGVG